ncbi:MAG: hypothetical protein DRR42_26075 [Gammaproteobacteria bacterium]|nr:MAG: hypothetical protein DRR42_26075 [Gammaproteobacteria bacterium]
MAGKVTESFYSEEFLQLKLEQQICEFCELHSWSTAVSVANPLDILIMLEEDEEDINKLPATNPKKSK